MGIRKKAARKKTSTGKPKKPVGTTALRDSEARFHDLIELSSDWYWEQDENFRFIARVGKAALGKVGLRVDEGLGKTRWELPYIGVSDAQWAEHKATLAAHTPFQNFEAHRLDGNGKLRLLSISGRPIFDERGRFKGYRGIGKDITEQREREDSLLQFRAAIDSTADGIHIVDYESMRFIDVNRTACSYLGYTRDEFLKLNITDIAPNVDLAKLKKMYDRLFDGLDSHQADDIVHVHKNGAPIPIEIHRSGTIVNGKRIVVNVVRDISERLKRDAALRESEARFRDLIEFSLDWYWEQDEQYRFTILTDNNLAPGMSRKGMIGQTRWSQEGPLFTKAQWDAHRADLDARRVFRDLILPVQQPDGGVRYIKVSGKPFYDEKGTFKGYRGLSSDITTARRQEERLRQSEAQYRELTELSSDWYWQQDENFRFVEFAGAFAERNGVSSGTFIGKARWDVPTLNMTPQDWARHKAQLERHEPFHELELCRQQSNGTVTWASISGRPIFDHQGHFKGYRGIGKDISSRKIAEQELRDSETRFRDLSELSSDWFWEMGPDLKFTDIRGGSEVGKSAFTSKSHNGKYRWELPYVDVPEGTWEKHKADLDARAPFYELILKRRLEDGSVGTVSISGKPLFDKDGVFLGYRGVGKDITQSTRAQERIQYLATHDSLTGLPNRAMFGEMLNLAIESGRRYKRQFALLFLDLDRFKNINDTFGHDAGDLLLKEMSKRLSDTLRSSDVVARLGGDEFVVLVQEVGDDKLLAGIARKVLSALIKPMNLLGQECRVTASIGIAIYPKDAQDEQVLMKNADIAMYRAKEEGKNNFQFYSEQLNTHTLERMALETSLRRALEREELSLHYQAKQDLKSGEITGVEALLRWLHPDMGMISPAQFIPLAEETGLIIPIGKWVLRKACQQNMEWQKQGLPPLCMAVNLSPRQFNDEDLVKDVADVLKETGLQPQLLELELTESVVMQNPERAIKVLGIIKSMGVRLAIDDFGVGYSSLAQIKRFPIDTLKVDRSFIREIPQVAEDNAITEAIINMGKTLSLTVIAEGVETAEQKQFLREHDCDEMQGYFFSKPIEPERFAELLRKHTDKKGEK